MNDDEGYIKLFRLALIGYNLLYACHPANRMLCFFNTNTITRVKMWLSAPYMKGLKIMYPKIIKAQHKKFYNHGYCNLPELVYKSSYLATSLSSPANATTVRKELSTSSTTAPASPYDSNSCAVNELCT